MQIKLTRRSGNTIGGRQAAVRMASVVLLFAGAYLAFTGVAMGLAGIPVAGLGGFVGLRWGLSDSEIDRLPPFLHSVSRR